MRMVGIIKIQTIPTQGTTREKKMELLDKNQNEQTSEFNIESSTHEWMGLASFAISHAKAAISKDNVSSWLTLADAAISCALRHRPADNSEGSFYNRCITLAGFLLHNEKQQAEQVDNDR